MGKFLPNPSWYIIISDLLPPLSFQKNKGNKIKAVGNGNYDKPRGQSTSGVSSTSGERYELLI